MLLYSALRKVAIACTKFEVGENIRKPRQSLMRVCHGKRSTKQKDASAEDMLEDSSSVRVETQLTVPKSEEVKEKISSCVETNVCAFLLL